MYRFLLRRSLWVPIARKYGTPAWAKLASTITSTRFPCLQTHIPRSLPAFSTSAKPDLNTNFVATETERHELLQVVKGMDSFDTYPHLFVDYLKVNNGRVTFEPEDVVRYFRHVYNVDIQSDDIPSSSPLSAFIGSNESLLQTVLCSFYQNALEHSLKISSMNHYAAPLLAQLCRVDPNPPGSLFQRVFHCMCQRKFVAEAMTVFEMMLAHKVEMHSNSIFFPIYLLTVLADRGDYEKAALISEKLVEHNITPIPSFVHAEVLRACVSGQEFDKMIQVWNYMKESDQDTLIPRTNVIKGLIKVNQIDRAFAFYEETKREKGLDGFIVNLMLSACKGSYGSRIPGLLEDMQQFNIPATGVTYNIMAGSYFDSNRIEAVMELYNDVVNGDIEVVAPSFYRTMIVNFNKRRLLDESIVMFEFLCALKVKKDNTWDDKQLMFRNIARTVLEHREAIFVKSNEYQFLDKLRTLIAVWKWYKQPVPDEIRQRTFATVSKECKKRYDNLTWRAGGAVVPENCGHFLHAFVLDLLARVEDIENAFFPIMKESIRVWNSLVLLGQVSSKQEKDSLLQTLKKDEWISSIETIATADRKTARATLTALTEMCTATVPTEAHHFRAARNDYLSKRFDNGTLPPKATIAPVKTITAELAASSTLLQPVAQESAFDLDHIQLIAARYVSDIPTAVQSKFALDLLQYTVKNGEREVLRDWIDPMFAKLDSTSVSILLNDGSTREVVYSDLTALDYSIIIGICTRGVARHPGLQVIRSMIQRPEPHFSQIVTTPNINNIFTFLKHSHQCQHINWLVPKLPEVEPTYALLQLVTEVCRLGHDSTYAVKLALKAIKSHQLPVQQRILENIIVACRNEGRFELIHELVSALPATRARQMVWNSPAYAALLRTYCVLNHPAERRRYINGFLNELDTFTPGVKADMFIILMRFMADPEQPPTPLSELSRIFKLAADHNCLSKEVYYALLAKLSNEDVQDPAVLIQFQDFIKKMEENQVPKDPFYYSRLLWVYCRVGMYSEVEKLIQEMEIGKVYPTKLIYDAMLNSQTVRLVNFDPDKFNRVFTMMNEMQTRLTKSRKRSVF